VVAKSGSSEPRWQKLQIDGEQDVPVTRAGSGVFGSFLLRFSRIPKAVVFRIPGTLSGGAYCYAAAYFNEYNNGWIVPWDQNASGSIESISVTGTTMAGTVYYDPGVENTTEFLPIYE